MKKLLIGLLAACMLTGTFTGCGDATGDKGNSSKPETSTPESSTSTPAKDEGGADVNSDGTVNNPDQVAVDKDKLVFWSLFSGGDGAFMDQIIKDYNATSPKKQVQSVMLVWADYYTKLSTAVAANKGPDIGVSHQSRLAELVQNGIILPVDDPAKNAGVDWSKFGDTLKDGVSFEGEHYAIPLDVHAEILYYNKDLLEKAGVPVAEDGSVAINSFDEFKGMLDKAKATAGEGTALSLPMTGDDPWRIWWATYFQMGGTPILNDAADGVTMDKDIAVKAAESIYSLYKDGYIQAGIEDHQKYFQNGSAAFEFGGTWAVGVYEATENLKYGGIAYPKLFNDASAYADMHTFILPVKKSRNEADTDAAVAFMNYATSTGATTWAGSGQIVANTDVLNSEEFNALPNRSLYKATADNAVFAPLTPTYGAMKDAMIKSLDTVWSGQTDAKTAVDNMYTQIESGLS